VAKTQGAATQRFVYDEAGRMIHETGAGSPRTYLWSDDAPIAVIDGTTLTGYIVPDNLGTPRAITNSTGTAIWRWDQVAGSTTTGGSAVFGQGSANTDPDGDGTHVTFNPRFPGQYLDAESGLHYNYFRDYEPGTGRYVQSDPIGLKGGLSTYGYGDFDPLSAFDPKGLTAKDMSDAQCCQYARGQVSSNAEGTVACCNGRKILCTWPSVSDGAPPGSIIAKCRRRHEEVHLDDAPCPEGCPDVIRVPKRDRPRHECESYTAEVDCLRSNKFRCGKNVQCKQTIEAEVSDRGRQQDHWCSQVP
jgi:RHS repeat-associated protein